MGDSTNLTFDDELGVWLRRPPASGRQLDVSRVHDAGELQQTLQVQPVPVLADHHHLGQQGGLLHHLHAQVGLQVAIWSQSDGL